MVVLMPLLAWIVQDASLLSAIASLEINIIGEVIEEMEDKEKLITELRNKVSQTTASEGNTLTKQEVCIHDHLIM